jgi:predicted HNH restriction endonuclease
MITTRADRRCEICHRGESGRWLEAHERWEFDHQTKVQALCRLICLCTSCHTATHYDLAKLAGKDSDEILHRFRPLRVVPSGRA